jgi:hypothetical protein
VLTIGKLGSSRGQLAYCEDQVAQGLEDYFSSRGERRFAGSAPGAPASACPASWTEPDSCRAIFRI